MGVSQQDGAPAAAASTSSGQEAVVLLDLSGNPGMLVVHIPLGRTEEPGRGPEG